MIFRLVFLIMLLGISPVYAVSLEVSTSGSNVGIGTTSQANALSVGGSLAVGNASYTGIAAPSNGMTIQGNVGIASVAPRSALDVNGTATVSGFKLTTGASSGSVLTSDVNGTGTWGSTPGNVGVGTTNYPAYYNANGQTVVAFPGVRFVGSNVGIGSAAPGSSVDIQGTARSTGGFQVSGSGAGKVGSVSGILIDGANSPATSPGIFVTTANNVGVGTIAAASKLTVEGTSEVKGFKLTTNPSSGYLMVSNGVGVGTWMSSATLGINGSPGGSSGQLQWNSSGVFNGVASSTVDSSGNVGIGTFTTSYGLSVGGKMASYATGDRFIGYGSGNLGVGTSVPMAKISVVGNVGIGTQVGDSFITTAAPSGGMLVRNNVGIGTLAPGTKLDVTGTTRTTGLQLNLAPLAGGNVLVSNSVGVGTWMPPATIGAGGGGSGTVTSSTINTVAKFAATGTTVQGSSILFDTATNVGVGTSVPAALFDVNRKMMVFSGGNVGIGTITPGQVLDVNGAIRSTSSGVSLFTGGNVGIGTSVNAPNALYVVGTPMFTTGLNIGIGTAAPTRLCISNNAISTCP